MGEGGGDAGHKRYFELVKPHPEPGRRRRALGAAIREQRRSEVATFVDAFPNATGWGNTNQGEGYDTVLLGTSDVTRIDVDALQAKLETPEYARVTQSLGEVGFTSLVDVLATYAGSGPELAPWLRDAELNRDRNLRLQFLAGMGNNEYQGGPIYSEMLSYRKYPERLFVASGETGVVLRQAIGGGR